MSAAPTQYTRVNNFVSDATNNPSITVAGIATDLDAEYEAIKTSVNQTISRLNEIQRPDGLLRSAVLDPTEYAAITAAVSGATNAGASATSAASSAASASTSATTATNRATEASTSATNAAGSATLATQRATAAANSATNAATSETNATNMASAAATSATAAATSATSASNSAGTASTKASEASASAANAATSASTASTKATEAAASAASVAGQATTATNAATSATLSAATATTKANNAADSAVSAQNSATIATTKAAEAALSALDANTAKTLATNKAAEAVATVAALNSANAETLTNANAAAASATAAATSATASATSATNAATSATNASTSATNAATSATSANTALASVNLIFDTFDDRFLGSKTSDPTVDNDGNAILAGAVYYNSTTKEVKFFNGVTWDSPSASATNSATASAASATAAATSATNAATSATNAATSATNAATSATSAATSATNAAASYDSFDDRYLGPKATAPTLDNDGSALLVGALYWNTSTNKMMVWSGSAWSEAFGGEPTIPTGTTSQFWRGDKTWQTIPSALETQLTGFSTTTTEAGVIFTGGGFSNVLIPYSATYQGKRQYYANVPDPANSGSYSFYVNFGPQPIASSPSVWTVRIIYQDEGDGYWSNTYTSTGDTEYPWQATWTNASLSMETMETAVGAADTILVGIGKLQAQITSAAANIASNVRNVALTGLSVATSTAVAATDSILVGIGKLQAQITSAATDFASNVRGTTLTGLFISSSAGAITAVNTVVGALGQLQGQINDAASNLSANVRTTPLTGLVTTSSASVTASDTLIDAIGRLQRRSEIASTNISNADTWIVSVNSKLDSTREALMSCSFSFSALDLTGFVPSVMSYDGGFNWYRMLTKTNHGLKTGDSIFITGQTGNTAVFNGLWRWIQVEDANTISLSYTSIYDTAMPTGPFAASLSVQAISYKTKPLIQHGYGSTSAPAIRRTAAGIYHLEFVPYVNNSAVIFAKSYTPSVLATSTTFATFCDTSYLTTNIFGNVDEFGTAIPTFTILTRNASGVATNYGNVDISISYTT